MTSEKQAPVGMRAQRYAVEIEEAIRQVVPSGRAGLGGVADSDYIRKQPFKAIEEALWLLFPDPRSRGYRRANEFLGDFDALDGRTIDDILESEIGTKALDKMIETFRRLFANDADPVD